MVLENIFLGIEPMRYRMRMNGQLSPEAQPIFEEEPCKAGKEVKESRSVSSWPQ
jgi:hypothetical protein